MKSFSVAKIQDLEHYVTPHLEHDKPDIAIIHIGSNNVSFKILDIDALILAENVIKIGNKCIYYDVEEVVISSILVKESIRLSSLIRKVNDWLRVSNQVDINDLVKMSEVYSKNPILGYLNINSPRNKIVSLRDAVAKGPIDILCIDETKFGQ